jgi:predicted DNA-binding transcriptional regulator AlpA
MMNASSGPERLLFSVPDVEAATGFSRSQVYAMLRRGELPSVTIAGRLRVPADALRALIARELAKTQPAA